MGHDGFRFDHDTITRVVHKVLWHRTTDIHLIEDICQNVLVACWKKERDQGLPWDELERFVVRVALNQFSSAMRKRKLLPWSEGFEEGSSHEDPAVALERAEQSLMLLARLHGLPSLYREVAWLHLVEGWTHDRIAKNKGVNINTIKTRFHRAKALLIDVLQQHFLN